MRAYPWPHGYLGFNTFNLCSNVGCLLSAIERALTRKEQAAATPGLEQHSTALAQVGVQITANSEGSERVWESLGVYGFTCEALSANTGERPEEKGDPPCLWLTTLGSRNQWFLNFELSLFGKNLHLSSSVWFLFLWRHLGEALLELLQALNGLDVEAGALLKEVVSSPVFCLHFATFARCRPSSAKAWLLLCCPVWRTSYRFWASAMSQTLCLSLEFLWTARMLRICMTFCHLNKEALFTDMQPEGQWHWLKNWRDTVIFTPLRVGWPPTPQVYFGPWEGLRVVWNMRSRAAQENWPSNWGFPSEAIFTFPPRRGFPGENFHFSPPWRLPKLGNFRFSPPWGLPKRGNPWGLPKLRIFTFPPRGGSPS